MQYTNLLTDCSSSHSPISCPGNGLIMYKLRSTPYIEFNLKLNKEWNGRRRRKCTLRFWQHKWLWLRVGRLHWYGLSYYRTYRCVCQSDGLMTRITRLNLLRLQCIARKVRKRCKPKSNKRWTRLKHKTLIQKQFYFTHSYFENKEENKNSFLVKM